MKQAVGNIGSRHWFAALAFSAVFLVAARFVVPGPFEALERYTYDLGVLASSRTPSNRVVVIAIDDASIARIGPLPWPRSVHAQLLDELRESGAAVVASTLFFPESRNQPGLTALQDLLSYLSASPLTQTIPAELDALNAQIAQVEGLGKTLELDQRAMLTAQGMIRAANPRAAALGLPPPRDLKPFAEVSRTWTTSSLSTQYESEMATLRARLLAARNALSADDSLAVAMQRHGKSLLPIRLLPAAPMQGPDESPMENDLRRFALEASAGMPEAQAASREPVTQPRVVDLVPPRDLSEAAAGIGQLLFEPDADGVVRHEALAVRHPQALFPSLSVAVTAAALDLGPGNLKLQPGQGLRLGKTLVHTTPQGLVLTHFYRDVGGRSPFPVYSFQEVREGRVPSATFKDKIVLIGITAAATGRGLATPVGSGLAPVMVLAHSVSGLLQGHFFVEPRWSGPAGWAMLLLATAYLAWVLPRLGLALGLAVSGGAVAVLLLSEIYLLSASALWVPLSLPAALLVCGQLFMTARSLPLRPRLSDSTRDRLGASSPVSATLAFPARAGEPAVSDTLVLSPGPSAKRSPRTPRALAHGSVGLMTTLGRYEVERELGKGAMGVVYLGRDPKIGRRVAIKTMSLSSDFACEDLAEVKTRFFREAEAAGKLSHPHIVQIFDAGEDQDLAFIAMEFVQGHDLVRHTKAGALLPVAQTLKVIADAADALDYAHQRNVVHRDIKPANLMLAVDTEAIKVMDFGIARITDAGKTKTGMVLGTPSYMSPEQLSGKKVDGRSDLFSLGVTTYQLLTGTLPFQAESISTLMFKITREPHVPITTIRPDLPAALEPVIDRALHKNAELRYQRGSEFACDLRNILAMPA